MGIILTVISLFFIFLLSWHFIQLFLHKLQNLPPSPTSLPIIGHLHLLRDPVHETLTNISKRLGPVFLLRIGHQRFLHISSPSVAEDCLRQNDAVCADRPRIITGDIFGYGCTSIVWAPYGSAWRNFRRIYNGQMLSPTPLQLSTQIRSEEVKALIKRTLQLSKEHENVNIGQELFDLTHFVVIRLLAKEGYEGEESKRFRKVMRDVMRVEGVSTIVDVFPWLSVFGLRGRMWKKFGGLAKERDDFINNLLGKNRREMGEIIEEENSNGNVGMTKMEKQRTLIEALVSMQKSDPEFYKDDIIKGLLQVALLAGTDTTATTMEWALSLMLNHPNILKKAQNEIGKQVGYERLVDESDLINLPYLRCIIYETLRIYPPAPMLLPHVSSDKCVIGGYTVPRGTTIFVNVWAIHHDPTHWTEPETFRPERFEGWEEISEQMKYKFMPFGSGRRGCPGEGMAIRVASLTLASLLQCFQLERPSPELINMDINPGFSIPKAQHLRLNCRPRDNMVKLITQA